MTDRSGSDEAYVLNLLDQILGRPGLRQHRFDWLRGDPASTGKCRALPVDAYWPEHNLVVEIYEGQHDHAVSFFDKPGRPTVSGVDRGQQRRIYDQRRRDLIPTQGLTLLVVRTTQLAADHRGRLHRHTAADEQTLRQLIGDALAEPGAVHDAAQAGDAPTL